MLFLCQSNQHGPNPILLLRTWHNPFHYSPQHHHQKTLKNALAIKFNPIIGPQAILFHHLFAFLYCCFTSASVVKRVCSNSAGSSRDHVGAGLGVSSLSSLRSCISMRKTSVKFEFLPQYFVRIWVRRWGFHSPLFPGVRYVCWLSLGVSMCFQCLSRCRALVVVWDGSRALVERREICKCLILVC